MKDSNNVSIGKYFYDGDGKRVKKISATETTIFVYNIGGQLVAEYSTQIAQATDAKVSYLTNDHLGSPRITTDTNGQVVSRRDFQPFGEEIQRVGYGADTVRKQFTGYEKDEETDLDFAQARMYVSNLGRFTTIDPIILTVTRVLKPQTLNLYSYCNNNPLVLFDPTGEKVEFGDPASEKAYGEYKDYIEAQYKKNPKKFAGLRATIQTLEDSGVIYKIGLTTSSKHGAGTEGQVTASDDGKKVLVNIVSAGGPGQKFSQNALFAHELEHARQFNEGEFGFILQTNKNGKYAITTLGLDITDEVKAWQAMVTAASPSDFQVKSAGSTAFDFPIFSDFDLAKNDSKKAEVLARVSGEYKDLKKGTEAGSVFNLGNNAKSGQPVRAGSIVDKSGITAFGCNGGKGCNNWK